MPVEPFSACVVSPAIGGLERVHVLSLASHQVRSADDRGMEKIMESMQKAGLAGSVYGREDIERFAREHRDIEVCVCVCVGVCVCVCVVVIVLTVAG